MRSQEERVSGEQGRRDRARGRGAEGLEMVELVEENNSSGDSIDGIR